MLLGNSGDDVLMKLLRWRASERGWVLNEYAMGERVPDVMPREWIVKVRDECLDFALALVYCLLPAIALGDKLPSPLRLPLPISSLPSALALPLPLHLQSPLPVPSLPPPLALPLPLP